MTKYRKRPVEIEAHQWDGTADGATPIIDWILSGEGTARFHDAGEPDGPALLIDTLEGTMRALPGDYIIRGVAGEHYSCREQIFLDTYLASTEEDAIERRVGMARAALTAASAEGFHPDDVNLSMLTPRGGNIHTYPKATPEQAQAILRRLEGAADQSRTDMPREDYSWYTAGEWTVFCTLHPDAIPADGTR